MEFLYLPFKEKNYRITEGWKYSSQESNIHGYLDHGAIDFALPRGTGVFAAADGWAVASYFLKLVRNKDGSPKNYKGKEIGLGLGYFVQIYHPKQNLYTSYGHLENIVETIPFHKPIKRNGAYWPIGHKIKPEKLPQYKFAKFVKSRELIGFVGDSGLTWGYVDYPERGNTKIQVSWDETHLHFEVFRRIGSKGRKKFFDPYGIKSDFKDYPDSFRLKNEHIGKKGPVLWFRNKNGLPYFSF